MRLLVLILNEIVSFNPYNSFEYDQHTSYIFDGSLILITITLVSLITITITITITLVSPSMRVHEMALAPR